MLRTDLFFLLLLPVLNVACASESVDHDTRGSSTGRAGIPASFELGTESAAASGLSPVRSQDAAPCEPWALPPTVSAPLWGHATDHGISGSDGIAGATVLAWPVPDYPGPRASDAEVVRWYHTRQAWQDRYSREATTGPDGSFEIGDLAAARYRIAARSGSTELHSLSGIEVDPGTYVLFTTQPENADPSDFAYAAARSAFAGNPPALSDQLAPSQSNVVTKNTVHLNVTYPSDSLLVANRVALMRIDPGNPPTLHRFNRAARWGILASDSQRIAVNIPEGTYSVGISLAKKRTPISDYWYRFDDHGYGSADFLSIVEIAAEGPTTINLTADRPNPEGSDR